MKKILKSMLIGGTIGSMLAIAISLSLKTAKSQRNTSLPTWEVTVNGNFIHFERVTGCYIVSTTHNLIFNEANVFAGTNKIISFQECYGQNGMGEQVLIGATILIQ